MTQKFRSRLFLPLLLLLCVAAAPLRARAQEESYKFDFGASVGMSGYLGDVNRANLYRNPGLAGALSFRYLADTRWTVRGLVSAAALKGDSRLFSNKFPALADYSFTSTVFDVGARVEFNFFPYGIGETFKRLRRWTPYLAVGLGACISSAGGGTWASMSIPMAVGVKFKLRSRLNLSAEFCMAKTLGDHLDGNLSDLQGIKSEFLKNTDWYSTIMIGISYEFGKRCETCHYQK